MELLLSILLIFTVVLSNHSQKKGREHLAKMYASGVRNQCGASIIKGLATDDQCEELYWDTYCNSGIGDADKNICEKKKKK